MCREKQEKPMADAEKDAIPFEVFASFKRIETGNPIISLPPPLWAAATHAIIVDGTVHYIWCKPRTRRRSLVDDARDGTHQ